MASGSKTGALTSSFGVSIKWSSTPNVIGNYSSVTVDLYLNYYSMSVGSRKAVITINGTNYEFTVSAISDFSSGLKNKWVASKTVTIAHGNDGKHGNITVAGLFYYNLTVSSTGQQIGSRSVSDTAAFDSIDRNAPAVSFDYSRVTANSFYLAAHVSTGYDHLQYSLNGGASWLDFNTPKTITGLAPNTGYQVRVRARRSYNHVYGYSGIAAVKTLGGSVLNSAGTLTIDSPSPILAMNWTVYDSSYSHTLTIKNGAVTVLTISGLTCSAGTNNKMIPLTAAQRTAVLNYMFSMASFTATFCLTTYNGNTQIGNVSAVTAKIQTTSAVSAPSFSDFSYADVNLNTVGVTENNMLFIKKYSVLKVTAVAADAKNGADIVSYKAAIGSKVVSSSSAVINFGEIAASGNLTLTVTVTDSRGFTGSISKTITVYDYSDISITSWKLRRANEVEPTALLSFSGTFSSVLVGEAEKNSLTAAEFRYREITGSYTDWFDLPVENDSSFGLEAAELSDNSGIVAFDPEKVYKIQIKVSDKITSDTVELTLPKGTPLVSLRQKRVGINNPNPQAPLDVKGEIMMNGVNVMGFIAALGNSENLNDIISSGIYTQELSANASTQRNYPKAAAGFLEVIKTLPSEQILQRYTVFDCSGVYIRQRYNGTWGPWKSMVLS